MFLKGLGSAHAIFVKTEQLFAILRNRFNKPTQQISRDDAFGITISSRSQRWPNDLHAMGAEEV
ncbi:MAG TPA: hypothetical protein P5121_11110, partial [Caldilineaceae bacterium]|nr:hypothetical protein [Caldilineaceae bacterium]